MLFSSLAMFYCNYCILMSRDPRGFAVKFYTEEGNWDIVGNNTPIFFIRCECFQIIFSLIR